MKRRPVRLDGERLDCLGGDSSVNYLGSAQVATSSTGNAAQGHKQASG